MLHNCSVFVSAPRMSWKRQNNSYMIFSPSDWATNFYRWCGCCHRCARLSIRDVNVVIVVPDCPSMMWMLSSLCLVVHQWCGCCNRRDRLSIDDVNVLIVVPDCPSMTWMFSSLCQIVHQWCGCCRHCAWLSNVHRWCGCCRRRAWVSNVHRWCGCCVIVPNCPTMWSWCCYSENAFLMSGGGMVDHPEPIS